MQNNMQAKKEKISCGKGTKRSDSWLSVTINPDVIKQYIQEYNGSKFVKLNININETPDKFGKDVSVSIDTWTPKGELKPNIPQNVKSETTQAAEPTPVVNDELPW
jgi:ribosomal protein S19